MRKPFFARAAFQLFLRPARAWRAGFMGVGSSSIGSYRNDFELVIRATKEVRRPAPTRMHTQFSP
jgi:hypothetical protein